MLKLTIPQRAILSAAAQRDGHLVLPFPTSLKVNGGTAACLLKGLITKQLIYERRAKKGEAIWKTTNKGVALTLVMTETGHAALEIKPNAPASLQQRPSPAPKPAKPLKKSDSKLQRMIDLLHRSDGASLNQLQQATGWQRHSVRGALSGLRKRGHSILRNEATHGSRYRIEVSSHAQR